MAEQPAFAPLSPVTFKIKRPLRWPGPEEERDGWVQIQVGLHPATQAWWHFFIFRAMQSTETTALPKLIMQQFVEAVQQSRERPDKFPPGSIYTKLAESNLHAWHTLYLPLVNSEDSVLGTDPVFNLQWRNAFSQLQSKARWQTGDGAAQLFAIAYQAMVETACNDCIQPFPKFPDSKEDRNDDTKWSLPRADSFMEFNFRLGSPDAVFVLAEATLILTPERIAEHLAYRKKSRVPPPPKVYPRAITLIDSTTGETKQLAAPERKTDKKEPPADVYRFRNATSDPLALLLKTDELKFCNIPSLPTDKQWFVEPAALTSAQRKQMYEQIASLSDPRKQFVLGTIVTAEIQHAGSVRKAADAIGISKSTVDRIAQTHALYMEFPGLLLMTTPSSCLWSTPKKSAELIRRSEAADLLRNKRDQVKKIVFFA